MSKLEYNNDGKVKCEECGKYFHRVACHVNKVHGMNAEEYKQKYGYSLNKGLCSLTSSLLTSKQSAGRYQTQKATLFIANSKKTRFTPGVSGRFRNTSISNP